MVATIAAVVAQDLGRLRRLRQLLETAALPVVGVILPESGGLAGMHAFLVRHAVVVVLYDLVVGADALPSHETAALDYFHQVQMHEPGRHFVVLTRRPHAVLARADRSTLVTVLASDPPAVVMLAAMHQAQASAQRPVSRTGDAARAGRHRRIHAYG
jgi:hypothetical protein